MYIKHCQYLLHILCMVTARRLPYSLSAIISCMKDDQHKQERDFRPAVLVLAMFAAGVWSLYLYSLWPLVAGAVLSLALYYRSGK